MYPMTSSLLSRYSFTNAVTFLYQFVDDDGKCYLEINYTFDIRKEWAPTD